MLGTFANAAKGSMLTKKAVITTNAKTFLVLKLNSLLNNLGKIRDGTEKLEFVTR